MPITFKLSTYEDFREKADDLLQMHWLEVLACREIDYAIDHDTYDALDDAGDLRLILVFEDDRCIGYAITLVHDDIHNHMRRTASTTMTFVLPEYRKNKLGIVLLAVVEADLKAFCPGALWRMVMPIDGKFAGRKRGLTHYGFKATECVHEKVLGE